MRNPTYLKAALACLALALVTLLLWRPVDGQASTTLPDLLGADVTGVSFYHDGRLREVTDVDAVNEWQLTAVDVSGWYTSTPPVSGYPVKRICLSLPPTCDNRVWFYADDTDATQVYAFLWLGEARNRAHPDGIYRMARAALDTLLAL